MQPLSLFSQGGRGKEWLGDIPAVLHLSLLCAVSDVHPA